MPDGIRLALGTLTRIPVPPPRAITPRVAGTAMLLAPVVGLVLGLVVAVPAQILANVTSAPSLLIAALALALLAWLTRAIHLDGLADTADALGSGRPAPEALDIARRSDIGPFGVVTLVLVLVIQAAALAALLDSGAAGGSLPVALATGRLAIALACMRGIPAARPDGLGATVAGSVPAPAIVLAWLGWIAVIGLAVGGAHGLGAGSATVAALIGGLLAGLIIIRTSVRRLGGITGDVLGAVSEVATSAVLVILVLLPA